MKRLHFATLRPVCPLCLVERREDHPLVFSIESVSTGDDVLEGVLQCSSRQCRREYPIIDGIPLIVPDVRGYIASQLAHLTARDDLSFVIEGILGEGSGPGSALDSTRIHLSSYAWDHYGEWDPDEASALEEDGDDGLATTPARPGSVARVLERGLALAGALTSASTGPLLDVGCAMGRASFELARRSNDLVLGVDLGYPMLRLASRVLRTGRVRYPRRRVGMLYDWREYPVPTGGAERVDFWACDAAHLPFAEGTFGGAVGLNVLDCVYSPLDLLRSLARVLRRGAALILSSPYDWTPAATTVEAWIGGHSPRAAGRGASADILRALLTPGAHEASVNGLTLCAEIEGVSWTVRMHERSVITYRSHLIVASRSDE